MIVVMVAFTLALLAGGALMAWTWDRRKSNWMTVTLLVLALVMAINLVGGGVKVVKPTQIAVVENRLVGRFYPLEAGTHIFPFDSRVAPLFTEVTHYDLRNQFIEIGEPPIKGTAVPEGMSETQFYGVPSTSDSPGQPVVFFRARGWAQINPANVVELHRRFGSTYLQSWVEQTWVSTLKAIQGTHPFDYAKKSREALQTEVEQALQAQLDIEGVGTLVMVSQLAIVDFDYTKETNAFLNELQQRDYERQKAIQTQQINTENQAAEKIRIETDYLVTKRTAEAEQAKLIAEASGRADAIKLQADAEAYAIAARYKAEAEGIIQVTSALAAASPEYLEYVRAQQWNGELPTYMMGNPAIPFITVPGLGGTTATTP